MDTNVADILITSRAAPGQTAGRTAGSARPVAAAVSAAQDAALKQACADFEALFTGYLLQTMRRTVAQSEMFSGGRGEAIFRDLQDAALAQDISAANGIGLSRMLYAELTRLAVKQAPFSSPPGQGGHS